MNLLVHEVNQLYREMEIDNLVLSVQVKTLEREIKRLKRRVRDLEGRTSELFSTADIELINHLYNKMNCTQQQIADHFGTSHQRICDVTRGYVKRGYDHE